MVRWFNQIPVASAFLLCVLPACSGNTGGGSVATEPTVAPAPEVAQAVLGLPIGAGTHGRVKRIGEALGQVDLRPDQRASLESLAADAEARQAPSETARRDLTATIAAQVEAGALDRSALQPKIDALTAAMRAQQPGDRAAFESVHAILDPAQRVAFVEAMRSSIHRPIEGWVKDHVGHPLDQWATELGLTDAQRATIKDTLHGVFGEHHGDWSHGPGHGPHGLLEAFKADTFSFDQASPAGDPGIHVTKMTGHLLDVAELALPILTPTQRGLAATKVRERALEMP